MPMHRYEPSIVTHYKPAMSPPQARSYSKSPTKPRRFMDFLERTPLAGHVKIVGDFAPVTRGQLLMAHTADYVDAFLEGSPTQLAESNDIQWSRALRDSVLLTNGSLVSATRAAHANPSRIMLSPTSGFHHARPAGGAGFCTFSGQVIAALDMWIQHGARGAWIDLDGHLGNSIEDTREYAPALDSAIPRGFNINPMGEHGAYLADLSDNLDALGQAVVKHGSVQYVCVALGADSHVWDQLGGGQLDTDEWIAAVDMVFESIRHWSSRLRRPVPVVLSLFGGYRDDHPESVLGLHATGLARALFWLAGANELADWRAEVRAPKV